MLGRNKEVLLAGKIGSWWAADHGSAHSELSDAHPGPLLEVPHCTVPPTASLPYVGIVYIQELQPFGERGVEREKE